MMRADETLDVNNDKENVDLIEVDQTNIEFFIRQHSFIVRPEIHPAFTEAYDGSYTII